MDFFFSLPEYELLSNDSFLMTIILMSWSFSMNNVQAGCIDSLLRFMI